MLLLFKNFAYLCIIIYTIRYIEKRSKIRTREEKKKRTVGNEQFIFSFFSFRLVMVLYSIRKSLWPKLRHYTQLVQFAHTVVIHESDTNARKKSTRRKNHGSHPARLNNMYKNKWNNIHTQQRTAKKIYAKTFARTNYLGMDTAYIYVYMR